MVVRAEHAIVIGGGVAGMLCAAALAEFVDQITILERDKLPETEQHRPGVPQSRHLHALLVRGAQTMEHLLPGLRAELIAEGAQEFDFGAQMQLYIRGRNPRPVHVGLPAIGLTRTFLEHRLRRRVTALPGVTTRDTTTVTGLICAPDGGTITGVHTITGNHGEQRTERTYDADLVIDASGRSSKLAEWLARLGHRPPTPQICGSGLAYVTCEHDSNQVLLDENCMLAYEIGDADHGNRGGAALSVENGRMMTVLYGEGCHQPPTDATGYTAFATTLSNPLFAKIVSTPTTGPHRRYAMTDNRRIDYHRMPGWPDRLLALGDSLCAFNPAYGQGMTVAAMQAQALHHALDRRSPNRSLTGITKALQTRFGRLISIPWTLAATQDARSGNISHTQQAARWYMTKVQQRLPDSPELYRQFLSIFHMVASPLTLARPHLISDILRGSNTRFNG